MEIPSVDNTIKKMHLSTTIFNDFTSIYYDDHNYGLNCFQILYRNYVNNNDHPPLIQECKANMDKVDYERKLKIMCTKLG